MINSKAQQDEDNYCAIIISDALADTYLYLSRTRHYLLNALEEMEINETGNEEIPLDVIEEIRGLYKSWKNWRYNSRLDLSKSFDLQCISDSAKPEDLGDLVLDKHSLLVNIIVFILFHEYGHLLLTYDKELHRDLNNQANDLLITFIHAQDEMDRKRNQDVDRLCKLLKERRDIFSKWRTEIAADIFGLVLCMQLLPKSSLGKTLAILSIINGITEIYPSYLHTRNRDEFDVTHPVSYIRFLLNMLYLASQGWKFEEFYQYTNVVINNISRVRGGFLFTHQ